MLKHGSLFSGIGGFDLAAEWMGWSNEFHCEWNEFGQRILKYYWPEAISYEDITKTDFSIHRGKIDILTGGFPCQPYSTAGKRKGKEDERHLWPEMLRAIREIQPRYIVGENVAGLISWNGGMVFEEVHTDLENEGYEVQAFLLPAAAVGAPHRRDRVWFVARRVQRFTSDRGCSGCDRDKEFKKGCNCKSSRISFNVTNSFHDGGIATNSDSSMRERRKSRRQTEKREKPLKKQFGRHNKFFRTNFEEFPTQSPICNGNDGFSERLDGITFPKWRNESIKGGGNAIVPHLAFQIFKAIEEHEQRTRKEF